MPAKEINTTRKHVRWADEETRDDNTIRRVTIPKREPPVALGGLRRSGTAATTGQPMKLPMRRYVTLVDVPTKATAEDVNADERIRASNRFSFMPEPLRDQEAVGQKLPNFDERNPKLTYRRKPVPNRDPNGLDVSTHPGGLERKGPVPDEAYLAPTLSNQASAHTAHSDSSSTTGQFDTLNKFLASNAGARAVRQVERMGEANRVPESREQRHMASPFPLVATLKKWAKKVKVKAEKAPRE